LSFLKILCVHYSNDLQWYRHP